MYGSAALKREDRLVSGEAQSRTVWHRMLFTEVTADIIALFPHSCFVALLNEFNTKFRIIFRYRSTVF